MDEESVVFQPKSPLQRDDCINRNADYACPNPATLQAVYKSAQIRCCTNEACMQHAAGLARISGNAFVVD